MNTLPPRQLGIPPTVSRRLLPWVWLTIVGVLVPCVVGAAPERADRRPGSESQAERSEAANREALNPADPDTVGLDGANEEDAPAPATDTESRSTAEGGRKTSRERADRPAKLEPKGLDSAKTSDQTTKALTIGGDKSGVTNKSISVPSGSGTIEGMGESFSAQLSTGIAVYTIPIAVPAGRSGVQPALSLSYSSSNGAGAAGIGWELGVPFIARQTDRGTPGYDDRADWHPNQDRFVFNGGQELVPVCIVTGVTGCTGRRVTERFPLWAVGWQYFRARVEGGFQRFFWSPDHRTWRVQDKSGMSMELGVPLNEPGYSAAVESDPANAGRIHRWHLVRQYDNHGNANPSSGAPQPVNVAVYRYQQDGGAAYLSDVYYTTPVAEPTTSTLAKFAYHVRILYEHRSDPAFSFRAGWRIDSRLRVRGVDVAARGYTDNLVDERRMVRRYHLGYAAGSHASLLASVQIEGRCGTSERTAPQESEGQLPAVTNCPRLPAMTFGYSRVTPFTVSGAPGPAGPAGFDGFDGRIRTMAASPAHSIDEEQSDFFDVNSDALPDVLVTAPGLYGAGHGLFLNGASGQADRFSTLQVMGVNGVLGADAGTITLRNANVAPLDLDADGTVDLLHMPLTKRYAIYAPRRVAGQWRWIGRAVATADAQNPKIDFGRDTTNVQVVDVNADGLVDVLVSTGTELQTFFSLGRYPGGDGQFGQASWTGSATAQLSTEPKRSCVPFSGQPVRLSDSDTRLADMNGDGLVDIVRVRRGAIQYWPGRGNGVWGTGDRTNCAQGVFPSDRHIAMGSSPYYSDWASTTLKLEDLNEDGLTDLLQVNNNSVEAWLNLDGVSWSAGYRISGTPIAPSFASRVRLLDINGSGTQDIVWGDASSYKYIDLNGGTRPRLLTKVENGLGKTTTLEYSTSTVEMLEAERKGPCNDATPTAEDPWTAGWCSKMPIVTSVVKRVTDTDNLDKAGVGRAAWKYTREYSYRDAVFDGRQREFRGFRYARERRLGDHVSATSTVETRFILGECVDANAADTIDDCSPSERWRDNRREALKGLPVVVEQFSDSRVYVTTDLTYYKQFQLYAGRDGREVWHTAIEYKGNYQYETTPYTIRPEQREFGTVRRIPITNVVERDLEYFYVRNSSRFAGVLTTYSHDDYGNQWIERRDGCYAGGDCTWPEAIEYGTPPALLLSDGSQWLWRVGRTYVKGSVSGTFQDKTTTFNAYGDPIKVSSILSGTLPLDRSSKTGTRLAEAAAAPPPFRSQDGTIIEVETTYDNLGNATSEKLPSVGRCRTVDYETQYGQLPVSEKIYAGTAIATGCGSTEISTSASHDRGFGLLVTAIDANRHPTYFGYDGFGRLIAVRKPPPDGWPANFEPQTANPTVEITYELSNPFSIIHTKSQDGEDWTKAEYLESKTYVDGLGRPITTLKESETAGTWIRSEWTDFGSKGLVSRKFLDHFWSGASAAAALAPPDTTASFGSLHYDAFGRVFENRWNVGEAFVITLRNEYHLFRVDRWDAEDLSKTGTHKNSYASEMYDAFGRVIQTTERIGVDGVLEERHVITKLNPLNQPVVITRQRNNDVASAVTRWIRYDSLGRMILNVEPNTTKGFNASPSTDPATLRAWRYAYDNAGDLVGTSDARGCGVNFIYDAAGRLRAEDYWPCQSSQADYSAPDLSTNAGIEVLYVYDAPSASVGGVTPPPASGAATNSPDYNVGASIGRLVAVLDRASSSWLTYNARAQVTQRSVQVARPDAPANGFVSRYAPRWYYKNTLYDAADRPIRSTTGSKVAELLGTADDKLTALGHNQSVLATRYSTRGTVDRVFGSYGTLISSVTREADGPVNEIRYGDAALTTTSLRYNSRRWIDRALTYRAVAPLWTNPAAYTPAPAYNPADPTVYQLSLQHSEYAYDAVGNPTSIQDLRTAAEWPGGAKPVSRTIKYDDLYRLMRVDYSYPTAAGDAWISPNSADYSGSPDLGDRRRGAPATQQNFASRVKWQEYAYDWLGNTSSTRDDANGFYDRSLGTITNDTAGQKPYQLKSATNQPTTAPTSGQLSAKYDDAGNLTLMTLVRNGTCLGGSCSQRFEYAYDEVGRLIEAKRWNSSAEPPVGTAALALKYAYDSDDQRIIKSDVTSTGASRHTLFIFDSLELRRAAWFTTGTPDYERTSWTEVPYLLANGVRVGRVVWHEGPGGAVSMPGIGGAKQHVFLNIADHLGSSSIIIDKATGELVERMTYQVYGGTESDYRTDRWKSFREDYRFTGKEEDVEVGLTYFGKRFLNPLLGRWVTADPLAVHTLAKVDHNLYAYVRGQLLKNVDPLGLQEHPAAIASVPDQDGEESTLTIDGDDVPYGPTVATDSATALIEYEGAEAQAKAFMEGTEKRAATPVPSSSENDEFGGIGPLKLRLGIGGSVAAGGSVGGFLGIEMNPGELPDSLTLTGELTFGVGGGAKLNFGSVSHGETSSDFSVQPRVAFSVGPLSAKVPITSSDAGAVVAQGQLRPVPEILNFSAGMRGGVELVIGGRLRVDDMAEAASQGAAAVSEGATDAADAFNDGALLWLGQSGVPSWAF